MLTQKLKDFYQENGMLGPALVSKEMKCNREEAKRMIAAYEVELEFWRETVQILNETYVKGI